MQRRPKPRRKEKRHVPTTFTCHTAGESPHIVEYAPRFPAFLEYLLLPPSPPMPKKKPKPKSKTAFSLVPGFYRGLWAPDGSQQRFSLSNAYLPPRFPHTSSLALNIIYLHIY